MIWAAFGDYWTAYHDVTFDGENRLIYVAPEITLINIEIHIYSDWKEWMAIADNSKYAQAIRSVGGDELPGGDKLGATFFMMNGWKVVIDHAIQFVGNVYSQDGSAPFVTELGQQLSTTQVSNLIDKIAPSDESVAEIIEAAEIPTADDTANAVWDKKTSDHLLVGTFGKHVGRTILTIKTFLGLK